MRTLIAIATAVAIPTFVIASEPDSSVSDAPRRAHVMRGVQDEDLKRVAFKRTSSGGNPAARPSVLLDRLVPDDRSSGASLISSCVGCDSLALMGGITIDGVYYPFDAEGNLPGAEFFAGAAMDPRSKNG